MNHKNTKLTYSLLLGMLFASTAFSQPNWRGNLDISIRNPSNVTIQATVSNSSGGTLFATEAIYPNSSKTYQKLASGDFATISANGKSYMERLNNSSLTLIFDGNRLSGGNGNQNGGNGSGTQPITTSIKFVNSTGRPQTITSSGPAYSPVDGVFLGGGSVNFEIPGDGFPKSYSPNIGATLTTTVTGKYYSMTVSGSGNFAIDSNGVSFNGNFLPPQNSGAGGTLGGGGTNTGGSGFGGQKLGFKADLAPGGLKVRSVDPGSLAQQMGLQPGDLIKQVNQLPISNNQQYQNALNQARLNGGKVVLQVQLAGTNRSVPLHAQLSSVPSVIGISGDTKS